LVTVGILAAALVAAAAVSTWQARVALDAQRQAEIAREQAEADRDRTKTAELQASAISDFLQKDLLRQASSDEQRAAGFTPDSNLTVKEALHRAAAKIGERFRDQPLVEAAICMVIGEAYHRMGEPWRAVKHLERAVELYQAHLGPDHPDTLTGKFRLADSYQFVGRLPDAITLYEQVLEKRRKVLGPDHDATLTTLNSLGEACRKAGRLDRAALLIEQVLEKRKAMRSPAAVHSVHDLALVYRDLGRYPEAIALLEQAVARLTVLNGPDHGNTLYSGENLADTYEKAGDLDRACRVLREFIRRIRKEDDHFRGYSAYLRVRLGRNLLHSKKPTEAEPVLREALAIYEKLNAADGLQWFHIQNLLGAALLDQQHHAAAEPLLLHGYEGRKQRQALLPANWKHWLTEAGEQVVRFYEVTGQPEKACEWRERLREEKNKNPS
jgi:tetratricopeptide (TPR) repeat protein